MSDALDPLIELSLSKDAFDAFVDGVLAAVRAALNVPVDAARHDPAVVREFALARARLLDFRPEFVGTHRRMLAKYLAGQDVEALVPLLRDPRVTAYLDAIRAMTGELARDLAVLAERMRDTVVYGEPSS